MKNGFIWCDFISTLDIKVFLSLFVINILMTYEAMLKFIFTKSQHGAGNIKAML